MLDKGKAVLGQWGQSMGVLGIMSIGLAIATIPFYIGVVQPMQQEVASLRARLVTPERQQTPQVADKSEQDAAAQQAASFFAALPQDRVLPIVLRNIFQNARKHAVVIQRGSYDIATHKQSRLSRYQMTLSIVGTDGDIRKFITRALRDNPSLILEQAAFSRKAIGDVLVQSDVQFLLVLRGKE